MNLSYLGDALDHWKGSLIGRLQGKNLLRSFAVDRMATDADAWQPDDLGLYAELVGVKPDQILKHTHHLNGDRARYFGEIVIAHDGDILLDPDTGIATSKVYGNDCAKYLCPSELVGLFARRQDRIVAVYQHISRKRASDRVEKVVSTVRGQDQGLSCGSYQSASAAMLFFSKKRERIEAIYKHFKKLLGRHADERVKYRP